MDGINPRDAGRSVRAALAEIDGPEKRIDVCSVTGLAEAAGVSRQSINELVRECRAAPPGMALRMGNLFGISPEFWLNLQRKVASWDAARGLKQEIAHIRPLEVAQ